MRRLDIYLPDEIDLVNVTAVKTHDARGRVIVQMGSCGVTTRGRKHVKLTLEDKNGEWRWDDEDE